MAGSDDDLQGHSPRTKGIISHFDRKLRLRNEELDENVRVANERLGTLESAHIETNTKLTSLQNSVATISTSLAEITTQLAAIAATTIATPGGNNTHNQRTANNGTFASEVEENDDDYSADTEHDGAVNHHNDRDHRRTRFNRRGMGPTRPHREEHDLLHSIKLKVPPFDGKYDPDEKNYAR